MACRLGSSPDPPLPMVGTNAPGGAWDYSAIDLTRPTLSGEELLVLSDYFGRYCEVREMQKTNARSVNLALEEIFSRLGLPLKIRADNRSSFNSTEFEKCLIGKGTILTHSVPYCPWQDGKVEIDNKESSAIFLSTTVLVGTGGWVF